jgi:hypothetical protein
MGEGMTNWMTCREFTEVKARFPKLEECNQQFLARILPEVGLINVLAALATGEKRWYRDDLKNAMGKHWVPLGSGRRRIVFSTPEKLTIDRPGADAPLGEWKRAFGAAGRALASEREITRDLREKLRAAEKEAEEYRSRFLGADADSRFRQRFDEVRWQGRRPWLRIGRSNRDESIWRRAWAMIRGAVSARSGVSRCRGRRPR